MPDKHLRPQLHFTPQKNWMNDPNGCIWFNEKWHLFFQHHPHSNIWGPMHWGHAVSSDLLDWKEQPIALYPDKHTGMAFSGTVVIDKNNDSCLFEKEPGLVAFYTGHLEGDNGNSKQQQCMAWSKDEGQTWTVYSQNPVITSNLEDFRDPKVFYHALSKAWIMVVVAGSEIQIFRSENLKDWSYSSSFGGYGIQNRIWECPDLFPLNDESGNEIWMLTISFLDRDPEKSDVPGASPVQYFLGSFDGYEYTTDSPKNEIRYVDYGIDFYAVQSWNGLEEENRRIWIGWANHWYYSDKIPTKTWRGTMSIPREVSLKTTEGRTFLCQNPVEELNKRRSLPIPLEFSDKTETKLPPDAAIEIICNSVFSTSFTFSVKYDSEEKLLISWAPDSRELEIDRRGIVNSGFHEKYPPVLKKKLPERESADFRIIIDASIMEIFSLGGEYCFSSLIFPKGQISSLVTDIKNPGQEGQAVLYVLNSVDKSSSGALNI